LTPAGRRLREATALGFNHLRSVLAEISDQEEEKALAIGCTHGFAHMWIMPRLADLQARLGDRALRVTTAEPLADFRPDEIDFEVRFGAGQWLGKTAIPLFEEEVFPVCSPGYLEALDDPSAVAGPELIARLDLLHQDAGEWGHLSWKGWLAHFGVEFDPKMDTHYIQNYALVLQASMEGQGVALAWRHLIEVYLRNGWLVRLGEQNVRTGKGYHLLHDPDHSLADIVRKWVRETA
jgi:DNA-binding transcriptional LysR family regulator